MLAAYTGIVVLTVVLVIHNVRIAVGEFHYHRYMSRLLNHMVTLAIVSSFLVTISYYVIDRAMNAADSLQEESAQHRIPRSLTRQ